MNACDIEIAIARHLGYRQHLIVPNVSWGLGCAYEMDMVVVTTRGYLWEIEIKTSKSDLKADLKKRHQHNFFWAKRLYFAIPESLVDAIEFIPERAGIFVITQEDYRFRVKAIRQPKENLDAKPLPEPKIRKLYELAAIRIWNLKEIVLKLKRDRYEAQKISN